MNWFIAKMYLDLIKDTSYIFVDSIQYNRRTLTKVIRKIFNLANKITFIKGEMVYIYGEKFIFGIDLKLLRYMNLDVIKIKNKIKEISSVFLDDINILIEYKNTLELLDNQVKYVPFIYSIKHGKDNHISNVHIPRKIGMVHKLPRN
jgi:hypothetical protein